MEDGAPGARLGANPSQALRQGHLPSEDDGREPRVEFFT
jgi:hypothetical protein